MEHRVLVGLLDNLDMEYTVLEYTVDDPAKAPEHLIANNLKA
jgi:hypothetical protein